MGSGYSKSYKIKYKGRPENEETKEKLNDYQEIKGNNLLDNINQKELNKNDQRMITVIIPLIRGVWENSYNIETPLSKIASDFKLDNNMNFIQKNNFIEFSFKNQPIQMNSIPLKTLINENTTTIHIAQEIKAVPGTEKLEESEIIDIVGKPFSDPFQIFTFEVKPKIIKTIIFNDEKIKQKLLDKYGIDSAYCNGNNFLYISGGMDQATNETFGLFWAIDLKGKVFHNPIEMIPKKNHSMIYVEKKVYIVGGDDVNTMYYDVNNKEINKMANLNYRRFEPSLIKHNNYLFCFDTSKKFLNNFENNFNFEKIDLYSDSAVWEIVKPEISPVLLNSVFSQKFFGVVEDFKENIIFVGGIFDNENKEKYISEGGYMNLQYNTNSNMIEKSEIEYKDISFSEKSFLPFDNKTYYILPNFNKRSPKIIYFYKDRNIIEVNLYRPNSYLKNKKNKIKTTQIKPSLEGLNLDMPKEDDNSNEIKFLNNHTDNNKLDNLDNNITSNYIISPNIIYKENEGINDKEEKKENLENQSLRDNKEIINNNIKTFNSHKTDKDKNINSDKNLNNNEKEEIIITNKGEEKKSENEEKENSIDINGKEKEKKNEKEIEIKVREEENKLIEGKSHEIKNENKLKEEKQIENGKKENGGNIEDSESNLKQKEVNINIAKVNNLVFDYNDISKRSISPQVKSNYKKILYVKRPDSLVNYHSSLDNRFNNNIYSNNILKQIKLKKNIPPRRINIKDLKKQIKMITKTEFNEFRENKNY